MKKHADKFILTGLIITGLGLLWLLYIFAGFTDAGVFVSFHWIIETAVVTVLFISMTILSMVGYKKGKFPGVSAVISMIISSLLIGFFSYSLFDAICEDVQILIANYPYGNPYNIESVLRTGLVFGMPVQTIGSVILLVGFLGWFRKIHKESLPKGSASFSIAGSILYFAASVLSCFNLSKGIQYLLEKKVYYIDSVIKLVTEILLFALVVFLAMNIYVKSRKGKMPTVSLLLLLCISAAGISYIFLYTYISGTFTYSMPFVERIEPLLSNGILMKLIVYVIFIIGTAGMLVKKKAVVQAECTPDTRSDF